MPEGDNSNMPRTDYCRLRLTPRSKPIFVTIVFLSIFCFSSLAPFSVAEGWAKDVTLEWDPNTEPDLGGYIVYYGTESGIYDYSLDVGNFTSAVISGLDEDTEYFFSISAYNQDGLSSALSNEVTTALAPSPSYQATSGGGGGGGGGGGCFISSAESRSPGLSEVNLVDTLRTSWQEIKQMISEFIAIRHWKNKPSQ